MTAPTLRAALEPYVERRDLPGLVALVARGADAEVEVIGARSFEDDEPLGRDAIFRIASLSKPIGAAVALMLVEDGLLTLDDPVGALLPELAEQRVLRSLEAELDDTVPCERPITLRMLLASTFGFGVALAMPGTYPIQRAEQGLGLRTMGPPWPPAPFSPDEWIARLGSLPLMHQPGEGWLYNTGSQVLGVLLERATGMPLEELLRERLFVPLGMADTGFSVPSAQLHRFTSAYAPDPDNGAPALLDGPDGWWSRPPAMPNLAGWLVSTVDDYWSFVRMLAAGGRHRGSALLSPDSVRLMTTDQLTAGQREQGAMILGDQSWSLACSAPAADGSSAHRRIGWDGGTGCSWRTDLDSGVTSILLTQRMMTSPAPPPVYLDAWKAAFGD